MFLMLLEELCLDLDNPSRRRIGSKYVNIIVLLYYIIEYSNEISKGYFVSFVSDGSLLATALQRRIIRNKIKV